MAIAVNAAVLALGVTGWTSVGWQLLTSVAILLIAYLELRARLSAALGFFLAIVFGISALVTAIRVNLPGGAAICAVVLCCEIVLILRWSLRRTSA